MRVIVNIFALLGFADFVLFTNKKVEQKRKERNNG